MPLRINPGGFIDLLDDVRQHGQRDRETGALLLTAPGTDEVAVIALTADTGIRRRSDLFTITRPAFDSLFTYAEDAGLQVRAMIHSHRGAAFLSATDRTHGLNLRGFISAVIPDYACPSNRPDHWGWWRFNDSWIPTVPATLEESLPAPKIIKFDAEAVHDH
ncbi:hypothetical protein E1293_07990 [Actinomadura darangshiensis]|uniref:JAB domain-containing protein n=1 Tax=Actinomadura darangshiensis TaxID=705336 RepID=A0A4R5BPG9_9ACTN|nr:hypothetical protein E1293_07990 [Actinomadura darangshiensis]